MKDLIVNKEVRQNAFQTNEEELFSEFHSGNEVDFAITDNDGRVQTIQSQVFNPKPNNNWTLSSYNDFKKLLDATGILRMQSHQLLI